MSEHTILVAFTPIAEATDRLRRVQVAKAGPRKVGRSMLDDHDRLVFGNDQACDLSGKMRLTVHGVDLLGTPKEPWSATSIVHAVTAGTMCLRRVAGEGTCRIDGGLQHDVLLSEVANGWARECAIQTGREGVVAHSDLGTALIAFGDDVRDSILTDQPELTRNRQIGPWVLGGAGFIQGPAY